jgi:uncharacterized protein (UPF0332 family)
MRKADRFLAAAQAANERGDHETSTSRSYFAVYHAIKALSPLAEQARTHEHVADWLERSERWPRLGDSRSIPAAVKRLLRWRNQADYDWERVTPQQSAEAASFAQAFIAVAKEMLRNDN